MHNKKVLIDAIRNLSNPRKTNKNKNYFDISNSQDGDFISAKDGVDTPIYKKVSVKPSPIAGRGLFAEQSIRAGEPIGVSHIRKKFMRGGEEYQAPFPSTTLGYYNHSKEPNVYEVDKGGHIVMVASRDINPGDEITSNYDQNEIEDLEGSSDFKRGGSTRKAKIPNRKSPKSYSRSLEATNRLFAQNPLFKKPESRKNKIFDPNAQYYQDGGEPPYNNLPPTYLTALQNFVYPNVKDDPERTGYNSVNNTISYDSQSPIENMDNKWWMEHELFHDLQNQAGEMSTSGVVGQRPNPYVASDESMQGYYDRRDADVERTIDSMIAQDPNLQFIPRNKLAEGAGPGFIGAEDLQYADPTTLEGGAKRYEQYIKEDNPSIFPNRKYGGLVQYAPGGYTSDGPGDPKKKPLRDPNRILPRWMSDNAIRAIQNTEVGVNPYMTNIQSFPKGMLTGEGSKNYSVSRPFYGVTTETGLGKRKINKSDSKGWSLGTYVGRPYDDSSGDAFGKGIEDTGQEVHDMKWDKYNQKLDEYYAGTMSLSEINGGWTPESAKPKYDGKKLTGLGRAMQKSPLVGGLSFNYQHPIIKQPNGYNAGGKGKISLDFDPNNQVGLGLEGGIDFYGGSKRKDYRPGQSKWSINPKLMGSLGTRPGFGAGITAGIEGLPKFMPKNFPGYFHANANYAQSFVLPTPTFSANAGINFPLTDLKKRRAQSKVIQKKEEDGTRNTTYEYGGIPLNLTDAEIQEYAKGGYIVEDYDPSIPELNTYAGGGMVEATVDENGEPKCPDGYDYNSATGYCEKKSSKCPNGYKPDGKGGCIEDRCQPGYEKDASGNCVPDTSGAVYVEDENDPRYQDYLTRKKLSNISKIPNSALRHKIWHAFDESDPNYQFDQFYDPEKGYSTDEIIKHLEEKDYNWDSILGMHTGQAVYPGMYGSQVMDLRGLKNFDNLDIQAKNKGFDTLNDSLTYGYSNSYEQKYKPAGYDARIFYNPEHLIGVERAMTPDYKYYVEPNTSIIEDQIKRDKIKKYFPNIPDTEINRQYAEATGKYGSEQPGAILEIPGSFDQGIPVKSDYTNEEHRANIIATGKLPNKIFGPTDEEYITDDNGYTIGVKGIDYEKGFKPESAYEVINAKGDIIPYYDAPTDNYKFVTQPKSAELIQETQRAVPKFDDPELNLKKGNLPSFKYIDPLHDLEYIRLKKGTRPIAKWNPYSAALRMFTGYKGKPFNAVPKEGSSKKELLTEIINAKEENRPVNFKGIPLGGKSDLKQRRKYKKALKDYEKNLPAIELENERRRQEHEKELKKLSLRRQAEEAKRSAAGVDPSTIIKWKYGGMLDTYAPGGWPPKGLRKSIKTIEPKSNKITIGNAKDLATNSSAAQAINAVKDRTLQLWNTSEGQKRLQNLINTTPSLQANLFFDSKDMVSDLANTRNINQEIIDYEALMDNIINEQNQVDSYYDQNLMEKNDYFNTTVDLDTKLKKTEEEYAKLLEHAKTKGGAFYDRNENAFVINPQYFNNAALPKVGMHEVIHLPGLKRGVGRTSIDEKLGGLDLKDQLDFDFSNASNNNSFYKHLNRKGNYLGGAKSYYNLNGGFERSPFLAELREDMLQNNIIKHPYQKVNSKMIKDYYRDYLKKEDKYPLRIFDIMTNKPKNFSLLSNTMNELPSFAPYVIGAGAATLLDNPFDAESNSEDGKYAEGGEPCPDGYIRNNSTGKCVLEIAPEQTPAEEWYKNWYANRVIQDEEGQKLLNEARPKLLKRTEKFPEVDYDAKGLGNASGMYNPMTGKISLNSSQMTSPFIRDEVLFHEKGHYITSPSMLDPEMDTYKKMKNHPVHKLREYETGLVNQALVPKNKVSKEEGKFYNYISGNYGEEISKRLMELRRLAGFKPDQEITDDDLKNFYQKAKTKGWTDRNSDAFVPALIDFQRFINSPQDLKMLLNKMAKNESRGIDEYAPQQAQYGGPLPKAKMGWPPKGLKRTSGSYKAPNINFNKTVPKYTPNPIKKTLRDINIESLGTANAVAKALLPTKVNPMQVLTLGHPIEGVGPFTGSPLNSIPFYGTKLPEDPKDPVAGVAFRKFGDNLDWVKNTGELNPAHGSALRFGKDQISKEGNWSEMGWANEKYPGVFAAGFDSHVPGSNLQINRMDKRNGVVVTEGDNPAISIMDPGVRLHRRLPFSNRYLDINMDKLRNDQFDWRTMGGNAQSLIERYGYTAGYAALLSALGLAAPQDKVDQYINEPIIRSYEEYIEPLINPKEEDGGEVDYELGQEINKATMEKLKKLGYTFQKIK